MRTQSTDDGRRTAPRPLTKVEIDQRIQGALSRVLDEGEGDRAASLNPRWITPAEIVRLVSPLLSRN